MGGGVEQCSMVHNPWSVAEIGPWSPWHEPRGSHVVLSTWFNSSFVELSHSLDGESCGGMSLAPPKSSGASRCPTRSFPFPLSLPVRLRICLWAPVLWRCVGTCWYALGVIVHVGPCWRLLLYSRVWFPFRGVNPPPSADWITPMHETVDLG